MFVGCSKSNDWVEVAEITYYINKDGSNPAQGEHFSYDEEHPLKIRFLEDNCLEISYWDYNFNSSIEQWQYEKKIIRVLPLSYEITYFED